MSEEKKQEKETDKGKVPIFTYPYAKWHFDFAEALHAKDYGTAEKILRTAHPESSEQFQLQRLVSIAEGYRALVEEMGAIDDKSVLELAMYKKFGSPKEIADKLAELDDYRIREYTVKKLRDTIPPAL